MKRPHTSNLTYVIWKEGPHYVSQCLNVDVSSFGKTRQEALANLQEVVELYMEDAPRSDIASVERASVYRRSLQHA